MLGKKLPNGKSNLTKVGILIDFLLLVMFKQRVEDLSLLQALIWIDSGQLIKPNDLNGSFKLVHYSEFLKRRRDVSLRIK